METFDGKPALHQIAPVGRGAVTNPGTRFLPLDYVPEYDETFGETDHVLKTQFFVDSSKTVVSQNSSPDVGFTYSLNPYRGCEHGCAYCYARPTHEYLDLSSGTDFETKIFVKTDAPHLLRKKLSSKKWTKSSIAMSGVTDCYQPAERSFKLTRACLEVLAEFQNPAFIITKNFLVTRDIDVLQKFLPFDGIGVAVSVTTLDADLQSKLEPRASPPKWRLNAIRKLTEAGIPVTVMVAPVIPGLTDHEIPAILEATRDAGAKYAAYTLVRLPHSVSHLFAQWLEVHRPERKERVLNLLMEMRGGKLNDPNFGSRMRGGGAAATNISQVFKLYCKRYGFNAD